MSVNNTFESQAKEYLGIQGGVAGNTVLSATSLFVGEPDVNHVQLASVNNLAFIDIRSNSVTGPAVNFDARIVSIGGGTAEAQATLFVQSQLMTLNSPLKIMAGNPFKVDYSSAVATVGVNTVTIINFISGLFTTAPVFVATANTPTGETGNQFVHVEEVTASGFKAEYLGTVAAGTLINWIAIGM